MKKSSNLTILQKFFLTFSFFKQNDLYTYSLSCAFGFLYSLLPILLMITIVLIRFLHGSPELVYQVISIFTEYIDTSSISTITDRLLEVGKIGVFEIVIGLSIFWLARRFFFTVLQGVQRIFHSHSERRPFVANVIVILSEVVLVIGASIIFFIGSTLKSIINSDFLLSIFPFLKHTAVLQSTRLFSALFILCFVAVAYRLGSGTKPSWKLCFFSAFLVMILFSGLQIGFDLFLNINKYNLIYGVLGKLIIMLLELSFFFSFFLFFAQYVYVNQFFDILLLGEIYLLPDRNDTDFFEGLRRIMFIRPDVFLKSNNTGSEIINFSKGQLIFSQGDTETNIFYISKGSVELTRKNNVSYKERGCFFGEISFILNEPQNASASALTDVQLIKIDKTLFSQLLEKNPEVAQKMMTQISTHFSQFYTK